MDDDAALYVKVGDLLYPEVEWLAAFTDAVFEHLEDRIPHGSLRSIIIALHGMKNTRDVQAVHRRAKGILDAKGLGVQPDAASKPFALSAVIPFLDARASPR